MILYDNDTTLGMTGKNSFLAWKYQKNPNVQFQKIGIRTSFISLQTGQSSICTRRSNNDKHQ